MNNVSCILYGTQFLLDSFQTDCNLNHQDADGWTALWHAYGNSNEDMALMLLKRGASTVTTNNEGKTVVQEANENEDEEFIELFSRFPNS